MLKLKIEIGHASLEYTAEKSRNKRPPNGVSLRAVLEAKENSQFGIVFEEFRRKGIPPAIVALLRPLLQSFVQFKDPMLCVTKV